MTTTKEIHEADQERFKLLVQVLVLNDLSRFIRAMEHAEAFGCFTAPTAWIEKVGDLHVDLRAARAVQRAVDELRAIYGHRLVELGVMRAKPGKTTDGGQTP